MVGGMGWGMGHFGSLTMRVRRGIRKYKRTPSSNCRLSSFLRERLKEAAAKHSTVLKVTEAGEIESSLSKVEQNNIQKKRRSRVP